MYMFILPQLDLHPHSNHPRYTDGPSDHPAADGTSDHPAADGPPDTYPHHR